MANRNQWPKKGGNSGKKKVSSRQVSPEFRSARTALDCSECDEWIKPTNRLMMMMVMTKADDDGDEAGSDGD